MRSQGEGTIVHIASMAGKRVGMLSGVPYTASKTGLVAMTGSINLEERRNGIRACAICPGEINTPLLDRRPFPPPQEARASMLQPSDLAEAMVWIASLPQRVCIDELLITPTVQRKHSPQELAE